MVHRLDRDTQADGLLARMRADPAQARRALRTTAHAQDLLALVAGVPPQERGKIETWRSPDGEDHESSLPPKTASRAATLLRHARRDAEAARCRMLALRPLTGRTHKLRVMRHGLGHADRRRRQGYGGVGPRPPTATGWQPLAAPERRRDQPCRDTSGRACLRVTATLLPIAQDLRLLGSRHRDRGRPLTR